MLQSFSSGTHRVLQLGCVNGCIPGRLCLGGFKGPSSFSSISEEQLRAREEPWRGCRGWKKCLALSSVTWIYQVEANSKDCIQTCQ